MDAEELKKKLLVLAERLRERADYGRYSWDPTDRERAVNEAVNKSLVDVADLLEEVLL